MKNKGFTLVEMLIVIAVIGVLAVAVLSAINPVEQMRKARDARRKSNAAELLNAIERYYATNEKNPSMTVGTDDTCSAALAGGNINSTDLADLIASKELKSEFATRIGKASDYLYVGIDSTSDLVIVCGQIESDANITKYKDAANCCLASGGACTGSSAVKNYICVPE